LRKGKISKENMSDLLLPPKSKPVQDEDLGGQDDSCDLASVESDPEEVQGASPIHGGSSNVEWEASDGSVHENSKVVTKIGSGDAQGIHAGKNKNGADREQDAAQNRLVHRGIVGLVFQGRLIYMVAQDSQGEDGDRERVATVIGITEYTSEVVFPILYMIR
jgi:hypothetical protein